MKEVPPTLAEWFVRGDYNEFELLKKAFYVEFHFRDRTTSYFNLLCSFTNHNLERSKVGKSKKYAYRCKPVDEKILWKFIGAYMIRQLQLNGEAEKVGWAGVDIHATFIGKCRFKVFLTPLSIVNLFNTIFIGYFKCLAVL